MVAGEGNQGVVLSRLEPAFARGVNSIQLMKDGGRWWVVTIFWDAEREGNPVPADLIGKR